MLQQVLVILLEHRWLHQIQVLHKLSHIEISICYFSTKVLPLPYYQIQLVQERLELLNEGGLQFFE